MNKFRGRDNAGHVLRAINIKGMIEFLFLRLTLQMMFERSLSEISLS